MRIALSVGIALLLILSSIVGFGTYQDYRALNTLQEVRLHQNGTVSAATHAQQQATNVARQAASATAIAGVYPSYLPGQGTPVLFDPLQQPGTWDNQRENAGVCEFVGGAYQVSETQSNTFYSCPGAFSFSNFAFEVEVKVIQGECGGALFREDNAHSKFYLFQICAAGSFNLSKYVDNTGKNATFLIPERGHAGIKVGVNQTNVLAVTARGSEIRLFINKQQVATVQDKSYAEGTIAFFANDKMNSTVVAFQNMKIWTL